MRNLCQRDRFDALRSYAKMLEITAYCFWECGCMAGKFTDGRKRRIKCEQHKTPYPKTCPCGHNDELRKRTAYHWRQGDMDTVEELRRQRIEHAKECYGRNQ